MIPALAKRPQARRWQLTANQVGILLASTIAIATGTTTAAQFGLFRVGELQIQSLFFRVRGQVRPPNNLVIVAIDDDSLSRGPDAKEIPSLAPIQTWPWRRSAYAQVIDKIMAAGAKAVVVDVILDLPSDDPQADQQLQRVLRRYAGRVALAANYATSETVGGGVDQLVYPADLFRTQPEAIGFINFQPELNGQVRRLTEPYLQELAAAVGQPDTVLTSLDVASLRAARLSIPPAKGEYIHFYGPAQTFPTVSFWHVLLPHNWTLLRQQNTFKDKIVLIGPTAAILQDIHPTPFSEMSGIEIHANAIATLLERRALAIAIPDPQTQGWLLTLGLGLVGGGLYRFSKRAVWRFGAAIGLAAGWLTVGYFTFTTGLILPSAVPAASMVLMGLALLSTGAFGDQMEKLRLRRTLERYVSSPIVQEVLSHPEDFRTLLQGRQLNAAVLFCDIRGFTTLSYQMPAQQLVAQLNQYLDVMVEAITAHNGTIDKFIGDAVMAEFGCPVSQGDRQDAMNAIRGALAMRQALAELRQRWQAEGHILFYNGIGISYGEVIAGNIGSLKRLEYTVIGDAVNVASRVEGLTKSFYTDILITSALYDLVQDEVEAVLVGDHPLRGREATPTRLYSLIGLKNGDPTLYKQVHDELCRYLGKPSDQL
jgi:adenylate cyclase